MVLDKQWSIYWLFLLNIIEIIKQIGSFYITYHIIINKMDPFQLLKNERNYQNEQIFTLSVL
jgi:hypothetical protein